MGQIQTMAELSLPSMVAAIAPEQASRTRPPGTEWIQRESPDPVVINFTFGAYWNVIDVAQDA